MPSTRTRRERLTRTQSVVKREVRSKNVLAAIFNNFAFFAFHVRSANRSVRIVRWSIRCPETAFACNAKPNLTSADFVFTTSTGPKRVPASTSFFNFRKEPKQSKLPAVTPESDFRPETALQTRRYEPAYCLGPRAVFL